MKILAIIGSPRGMQGNTGRLLEEVLAGIKAFGAETEVLSLKDPNGLEYLFEPLRNKITR